MTASNLSRCGALCALATFTAAPAIAAAGAIAGAVPAADARVNPGHTADPTFDLIDLHRKAEAAHLAAIKELDRFESSGDSDHDWITEQPCHDEWNAFDALVGAAATTLPGLRAKLAYLQDIADREPWMLEEREGTPIRLIKASQRPSQRWREGSHEGSRDSESLHTHKGSTEGREGDHGNPCGPDRGRTRALGKAVGEVFRSPTKKL